MLRRVRERGSIILKTVIFVLVHLPSKAPPKEKVENSVFRNFSKIGPFTKIKPQNDKPSQVHPGTKPKASVKPSKIIVPGIPGIEKQGSPDSLKGNFPNGKTDGEIINERKPQLVIYQN